MLGLYDSNQLRLSSEGLFTNPLKTHHDGKDGSASVIQVFVHNDDSGFYYQAVTIIPVDNSGYDDTVGEYGTGFSVKLAYGTVEPLPHEWNIILSGDELLLPTDIGTATLADTNTYYPVWVRINVPGNTDVQNKTDIGLTLQYIENPVDV